MPPVADTLHGMTHEDGELTGDQRKALEAAVDWWENRRTTQQVFSIGGLAGTGKTWLIPRIARALGVDVTYAAPTNKAAAVLGSKLALGDDAVLTHHRLTYTTVPIYKCKYTHRRLKEIPHTCAFKRCPHPLRFEHPCGPGQDHHTCRAYCVLPTVVRDEPERPADLFIMDEASMYSEQAVTDTMTFGKPLILVGDFGQLPPVSKPMNPWMDESRLDARMTHIKRQASGSPIAVLAHAVRDRGAKALGAAQYAKGSAVSVIRMHEEPEGHVLGWLLLPGTFDPGPDRAVIVPTNKRRAEVNGQYHAALFLDQPVSPGDRVVALQRSPEKHPAHELAWPVTNLLAARAVQPEPVTAHNGTMGTVLDTHHYGDGTADLLVQEDPPSGRLLLVNAALAQFGREEPLTPDLYPVSAQLWDYAYAITAHRAQGSEFRDVVVLGEPYYDYNRWMYTAITRAKERVTIVRGR